MFSDIVLMFLLLKGNQPSNIPKNCYGFHDGPALGIGSHHANFTDGREWGPFNQCKLYGLKSWTIFPISSPSASGVQTQELHLPQPRGATAKLFSRQIKLDQNSSMAMFPKTVTLEGTIPVWPNRMRLSEMEDTYVPEVPSY